MKIGIIGAGVAGISAAQFLSQKYDVSLFEAGDYLGGHTNTIPITTPKGITHNVDTGFIVFNDPNYPNFRTFLKQLKVESQDSDMSFSFYDPKTPFYYASTGLKGLFAQLKNIARPSFITLLLDIRKFNIAATEFLKTPQSELLSMKDFIIKHQFSQTFINSYLLPMGAAIWSCSYHHILEFPAHHFIKFWSNHQLITLGNRPTWKTVKGGSFQYIKAFEKQFKGTIYKNCPVTSVTRNDDHSLLETRAGHTHQFDVIVFAVHGDLVLKILKNPNTKEKALFSKWRYSKNTTILHTDRSIMPPTKKAWASWNYTYDQKDPEKVSVTYYMNRLQNLESTEDYFVSLNSKHAIDPDKILKTIDYTHPIYNFESLNTQDKIQHLNGENKTFYCGSYLGYGFHEDAVTSSVTVAKKLGVHV